MLKDFPNLNHILALSVLGFGLAIVRAAPLGAILSYFTFMFCVFMKLGRHFGYRRVVIWIMKAVIGYDSYIIGRAWNHPEERHLIPATVWEIIVSLVIWLIAHHAPDHLHNMIAKLRTLYLRFVMRRPERPLAERRAIVRDVSLPAVRHPSKYHPHGALAAQRHQLKVAVDLMAAEFGKEVFNVQKSGRDAAGSLLYMWACDLKVEPDFSTPTLEHLVYLVDVDYYLDLNDFLVRHSTARNGTPWVFNTLVPKHAARTEKEYSYTFRGDEIVMHVSGGASYRHKLWDYGHDSLMAIKPGIFMNEHVLFEVERKAYPNDRELISLVPVCRYTAPFLGVEANHIERFRAGCGDYTSFHIRGKDSHQITIARAGEYSSVRMSIAQHDAILALDRCTSINMATAKIMKISGIKDHAQVATLLEYFRDHKPRPEQWVFESAETKVAHFTLDANFDIGKPLRTPYMGAFCEGALVHDDSRGTDAAAIKERVVRLQKDESEFSADAINYSEEFAAKLAEHLLDGKESLFPADEEEVHEKQARPTQRRILEEAATDPADLDPDSIVKTFTKAESYQAEIPVKDPRNISQVDAKVKETWSRYMYAVAEAVKETCKRTGQRWYAFGCSPKEVAEAVAKLGEMAESHLAEMDQSRMDGRVNELVRHFERVLIKLLFPKCPEAVKTHMAQYLNKAYSKHGVKFWTGFTRLSGSPETSIFNTFLTMLIQYISHRLNGLSVDDAFERTVSSGIYGGDDSLVADSPKPEIVEKAGAMVGQVVVVREVERGTWDPAAPPSFLARFYGPDIWYGDSNSTCDFLRQIRKFHLCGTLHGTSAKEKLKEKAYAYYLTDGATPVIGDFCHRILGILGFNCGTRTKDTSWFARNPEWDGVQFPNVYDEWMDSVVDASGCDRELYELWVEQLPMLADAQTALAYYMSPPNLFPEMEPQPGKNQAVVRSRDDEVIVPAKGKEEDFGVDLEVLNDTFDIVKIVDAIDFSKIDIERTEPLMLALKTLEKKRNMAFGVTPACPTQLSSYSESDEAPICFAFQSGNCSSKDCKYAHIKDPTLEIPKCKHFAETGKCKRGARCAYTH